MRLKALTIQGFKSFASKVTLYFDDGISCIVGPNGSGKSNILDAFKWVLGEQNIKELRGDNIEDILFNGSSNRQKANFATVSITFTDIDDEISNKWGSFSELTITRKLYRSGERKYLINNKNCRLKDIREFLYDNGISYKSIVLIEQGKIDKIIQASNEQLRDIFEEFAGIINYRDKKKEALNKLEESLSNLDRIGDILREVEGNKELLYKQLLELKEYNRLLGLSNEIRKKILFVDYVKFSKRLKDISYKKRVLGGSIEGFTSAYNNILNIYLKKKKFLGILERLFSLVENRFYNVENRYREIKNSVVLAEERLKNLNNELKRLLDSEKTLELENKEYAQKIKSAEKDLKALKSKISIEFKREKEIEEEKKRLEYEINRVKDILKNENEKLLKLMDEDKTLAEKLYKCNLSKNNIEKQLNKNANEKNFYIEQLNNLKKEHDAKEKLNDDLQKKCSNLNTSKKLIEDRLRNLKKEYGHSIDLFNKYDKKLKECRNKVTLVRDLINQLIIDKIDNFKDFKQQFPFRKIIDIDGIINDNELIYYGDILIFHDSIRKNLIDHLKENNLSINFIFESELESFLNQIRQKQIKPICENVYYNGLYFRSIGRDDKMEKLLTYKKELALLEEKILDVEERYRNAEREKDSLKADKIKVQDEYEALNINLGKIEKEINSNQQTIDLICKQIKQYDFKLNLLSKEDKNLSNELNEVNKDVRLREGRKKEVLEEIKTRKNSVNKIRNKLEDLEKQLNSVKDIYMKIVIERKELSKKVEYLEKELENYNRIYEKNKKEIKNIYAIFKNINININENNDKLIKHNSDLESSLGICNKLKEYKAELLDDLKNNKEYMQKTKERLSKWQEKIDNFNKKYAKFDIEEAKLNTQIENLSLQYKQQFNENITDENMYIEDSDKTLLTNKLLKIESKLKGIGPINMAAYDEYEKLQERYDFLKTQYDDINNSVKKINEMIKEFDKESMTRFNTAFNSIRENFHKVVDVLFDGGKGDIKLTEPGNALDGGIEIYVQPKGKRLRNLNLLSGGEKALTSLALLFSFFLYRKAPFCFLDEIDAPLDDSNVGKFINIVKELSKDTQFIIITHNYKTMEFATNIYGVTNSEPGISAVYSLRNDNLFNSKLTDNIGNIDKAWGY